MNAPCAPEPELFFSDDRNDQALAKAICANCPVSAECLRVAQTNESGLAAPARYGIWGGQDAKERAKNDPNKRRRRGTPVCGTNAGYNSHIAKGDKACDPCKAAHVAKENARLGRTVAA